MPATRSPPRQPLPSSRTPHATEIDHAGPQPADGAGDALLPHDRDEAVGATGGEQSPAMQQAHRDLQRGLHDTDRGAVTDRVYRRLKDAAHAEQGHAPPGRAAGEATKENPMAVDNENDDPVGTPVPQEVRKAGQALVGGSSPPEVLPDPPPKPRDLDQQQQDFTAEGSPPPGKVGPAEPVADDAIRKRRAG